VEKLLGLRKVASSTRGVSCLLLYMVGTAIVVLPIFYKLVHKGAISELCGRWISVSRTPELHRGRVYWLDLGYFLFSLACDLDLISNLNFKNYFRNFLIQEMI